MSGTESRQVLYMSKKLMCDASSHLSKIANQNGMIAPADGNGVLCEARAFWCRLVGCEVNCFSGFS